MGFKKIGTVDEKGKLKPEDQFLPNKEVVNARIAGREDMLSSGAEGVKSDIDQFMNKSLLGKVGHVIDPRQTLPRMGNNLKMFGGLFQRAEAGVANSLLNIQESDSSVPLQTLVKDAVAGVKGEKLGELGDTVRTMGVGGKYNEAIANYVGFFSAAGLSNLASGGLLRSGATKMQKAVSRNVMRGKVKSIRKSTRFFKEQADLYSDGIDEAFSGMRSEFDNLYKNIGGNVLDGDDVVKVQNIVDDLPTDVVSTMKKQFGKKFESNISSAKAIKDHIRKSIPKNVWNGLEEVTPANASQMEKYNKMIEHYFELNDVIAKNAGESSERLLALNAKFKDLHTLNKRIRPVLKNARGTTKTTLRNIKSEANQGELAEINRFNKRFFKQGKEILKEIDTYNRNKKIMHGLKVGLGVTGGGAMVNQFVVSPLIKAAKSEPEPYYGDGG